MCGMTLKGRGCTKNSFACSSPFRIYTQHHKASCATGRENASPRCPGAACRRTSWVPRRSSAIPSAPAPEEAWYVETISFLMVNFWWIGHRAITAIAVVQFGFAISRLSPMACHAWHSAYR